MTHCPVGALQERDDTGKVFDALAAHKDILKSLLAGAGAAAGTALILKFSAAILGADAAVGLLAGRRQEASAFMRRHLTSVSIEKMIERSPRG